MGQQFSYYKKLKQKQEKNCLEEHIYLETNCRYNNLFKKIKKRSYYVGALAKCTFTIPSTFTNESMVLYIYRERGGGENRNKLKN